MGISWFSLSHCHLLSLCLWGGVLLELTCAAFWETKVRLPIQGSTWECVETGCASQKEGRDINMSFFETLHCDWGFYSFVIEQLFWGGAMMDKSHEDGTEKCTLSSLLSSKSMASWTRQVWVCVSWSVGCTFYLDLDFYSLSAGIVTPAWKMVVGVMHLELHANTTRVLPTRDLTGYSRNVSSFVWAFQSFFPSAVLCVQRMVSFLLILWTLTKVCEKEHIWLCVCVPEGICRPKCDHSPRTIPCITPFDSTVPISYRESQQITQEEQEKIE